LNKNLKKLMPWTNAAKGSLLNFVKEEGIEEKVEVVMAPITPPEKFEKRKHSGVNFLFVGKVFYEKGGYDTLLAFDKISNRYDCALTMIAPTAPDEVKEQFEKNRKIKILGPQPYEDLKRIYSESDSLLFPSHYDTYGFVILEAFSYGIPVITVDSFSAPELVEHEKTGLVVKSFYSLYRKDGGYRYPTVAEMAKRRLEDCKRPTAEYINELASAIERIINEGTLRKKLSENAKKEALEGKFSLGTWKKKMGRIYGEALSS
ncbi:MAG: glycosyltransferase family 4 protein, partial [Candidatus Micrarchaeota archaeon]